MICATKKCIGNDVDKIQDIDTVPQERVVGDAGCWGDWGGYPNTLIFEVGKDKIAGAF